MNPEKSLIADAAWRSIEARSQKADSAEIQPLRHWLQQQPNAHAAMLSGSVSGASTDAQSAEELEALVIARLASGEITAATLGQHLTLIHRAVLFCTRAGLSVAPTRISCILRPPPSPFPPETADAASKVELWRTALDALLVRGLADVSTNRLWALLALSSVLHGALLDREKLKQLLAGLSDNKLALDAAPSDQPAVIEFLMRFEGKGNHHLQRWFVDPVSALLLARWPHGGKAPAYKETRALIREALAEIGVRKKDLPKDISDILRNAGVWWALRGAPADLHAMQRTFAVHDLTRRCWQRLQQWHQTPEPGARRTAKEQGRGSSDAETTAQAISDEIFAATATEHDWLIDLCMLMEQPTNEASWLAETDLLGARLQDYAESFAPGSYQLTYVEWLAQMHANPPPGERGKQRATAEGIFKLCAPRLLNQLGPRGPQHVDLEELEEAYRVILDDSDLNEPIEQIARGLRVFHNFIVGRYGVRHLSNPRETLGEEAALMPVDATVISIDEYFAAVDWLEDQLAVGADPVDLRMCRMVLMLAFRGGMRRGEIFGLRLCDIHDQGGLHLIVRPFAGHRLKTKAATRNIHIDPMLSSRERRWLREWVSRRLEETSLSSDESSANCCRLICRGANPLAFASIQGVVRRAVHALHAATQDPRIHLHHLRHAGGSWLWLKLRAPDYPTLSSLLRPMPRLCHELRSVRRLRVMLCGAAAGPARGYTYTVSAVLGHASPATSLAHYLHVDDFIRGAITLRAAVSTPVDVWQSLTGLSRSTVYARLQQQGAQGIVFAHRRTVSLQQVQMSPDVHEALSPHVEERLWRRPLTQPTFRLTGASRMATVSKVLLLNNALEPAASESMHMQAISARCDVSPELVEQWLARARELADVFDIRIPGSVHRVAPGAFSPTSSPEPDVDLQINVVAALTDFADRMDRCSVSHQKLIRDALALVPSRMNRRRNDVVFRGEADEKAARLFLRAMDVAGLVPDRLQVVLRFLRADKLVTPSWLRSTRAKELRLKRVPPPGIAADQARAYRRWVGFRLCSSTGQALGQSWRIGLFLACIAHG